jgi:hypothetical protein
VIRAHIANQQNPAPPPLINQAMDPAMQQFFTTQMQLIQNLTNTMQQMQAQQNQPPQPSPQPPRDRHKEFMSHNPPTFSHPSDPLDADDWLKTITKKLEIVQCTDREMVLYAAGRLVGQAGDWWDAYAIAHPNRQNITWQEFLLTQNPHPASSTQQAERASFTREQIPRRASQFSLKINKKTK